MEGWGSQFLLSQQSTWDDHFKRQVTYFGSQIWRFWSLVNWPCCPGLVVKPRGHGTGEREDEAGASMVPQGHIHNDLFLHLLHLSLPVLSPRNLLEHLTMPQAEDQPWNRKASERHLKITVEVTCSLLQMKLPHWEAVCGLQEKQGERCHTSTRLPADHSCTACSVGSMKHQLSVLSVKSFAWCNIQSIKMGQTLLGPGKGPPGSPGYRDMLGTSATRPSV